MSFRRIVIEMDLALIERKAMLIYFLALKLNKVLLEIKYAKTKTISHNFDVQRMHCSSLLSLALPAIALAFRSLSLACALYANEL